MIVIKSPNEKIQGPLIVLIYQQWCSYCVEFKPVFLDMDKKIKGASLAMYDYALGEPKFTKIPISTVPHLLFVYGNKEQKYEGKRTPEEIVKAFNVFSVRASK